MSLFSRQKLRIFEYLEVSKVHTQSVHVTVNGDKKLFVQHEIDIQSQLYYSQVLLKFTVSLKTKS